MNKKVSEQTRRSVLRAGAAGVAATGLLGGVAFGQKERFGKPKRRGTPLERIWGHGVRKDAHTLTADSDDVAMYREAVRVMKARSLDNPLDPMGWAQHWAHHSFFCATNTFQFQIHYGWNFFPWHRAYLANLEQKIRLLLREPTFALPYWDWTRNPTVPDWYWGADNPLANRTRLQEQSDVIPADFLEMGPAMRAHRWEHFGGRARVPGDLQVEGTTEQSFHNNVHNWIGGEMASFDGAGNDPIFQSHHGNIDRIWDMWQSQQGRSNPDDPRWLDTVFWLYGPDGDPSYMAVRDLLDTDALGYAYDRMDWRHTLSAANTPTYEGGGVDFGEVTPSPFEMRRIEDVAAAQGSGRVSLSYERMSLPIQPFCHRLFFVPMGADGAPTYVGTFTILPIPDLVQGLEKSVTSQVEIPPDALRALAEAGSVHVVGVPVPLKGRAIPEDPVPFRGVSIAIET